MIPAKCRTLTLWQYHGLLRYGFNLKTTEYIIPKWLLQDAVRWLFDNMTVSWGMASTWKQQNMSFQNYTCKMSYADYRTISRPFGIWLKPDNSRVYHSKMILAKCRTQTVWQYHGLLGFGLNLKTAEYVIPKWHLQDAVRWLSDNMPVPWGMASTWKQQSMSFQNDTYTGKIPNADSLT